MKVIGVLSDTHGILPETYREFFKDCDEIWHAGDVGSTEVLDKLEEIALVRAVRGNIDGQEVRMRAPEQLFFEVEGHRVFLRHIVGRPGHYEKSILTLLMGIQPTMVIAGHSHILAVQRDDSHGWLFINPGAAGRFGFHVKQTMLKLALEQEKVLQVEIWEKEK